MSLAARSGNGIQIKRLFNKLIGLNIFYNET